MIRQIQENDFDVVCDIVNKNWKAVYRGYVNPELLNDFGCKKRKCELEQDFLSQRLSEYVYEEQKQVLALLSFGNTEDVDKAGAFEIWRIYVSEVVQGKGIGKKLLDFAEQQAKENDYRESIIWAFKENIRAVSFYQKCGYAIEKEEYLEEPYLSVGVRLSKKL